RHTQLIDLAVDGEVLCLGDEVCQGVTDAPQVLHAGDGDLVGQCHRALHVLSFLPGRQRACAGPVLPAHDSTDQVKRMFNLGADASGQARYTRGGSISCAALRSRTVTSICSMIRSGMPASVSALRAWCSSHRALGDRYTCTPLPSNSAPTLLP